MPVDPIKFIYIFHHIASCYEIYIDGDDQSISELTSCAKFIKRQILRDGLERPTRDLIQGEAKKIFGTGMTGVSVREVEAVLAYIVKR